MNVAQIVASLLFGLGYLGIVLEHQAHVNKAAFALVMGGFLWTIVGIAAPDMGAAALAESSAEIFSIVVFLLAAMVLVEVLVHYRVFDYIQAKLQARQFGQVKQFWVMALLTFVFSAVLNNLTVTIVMIQIARKFFWDKNLMLAAVAVVVASNAGGAFSPVGDITTIMLWFAEKFTAIDIIVGGFFPSLALCLATTWLLSKKLLPPETTTHREVVCKKCPKLSPTDRTVVVTVLVAFLLPVVARMVNVPPVLGILLGVGITWLVVDSFRQLTKEQTHLNASIERFVQRTDLASIMFFIGILLAVSAIDVLGILEHVSTWLYGSQGTPQIIAGNVLLGLLSGVFDNIPLTAMAITILETSETALWVLLAIAVGTGGSFFLVGSASGVVAAGMLPKLTFGTYLRLAFWPVLVGFVLAIGLWLLGYLLL